MNLKIAIVEDDDKQAELIADYIARFEKESGEYFEVVRFRDGDEIASDYTPFDIIFLDIQMKRMNGMEAALYIREMDKDAIIIFITTMAQFAIKGYAVGALDFLLKPVSYFVFSQQLKRSLERIKRRRSNMYILLPTENGVVKTNVEQIIFIESFKHKMTVHTQSDGKFELSCTMKELEARLKGRDFFRCDNSFLVNLDYVKGVEGNTVLVENHKINISRPRKKAFMEALVAHVGETYK